MNKILSGKPVAQAINDESRRLIASHDLTPVMKLIIAGSDPASLYYVKSIVKQGEKLGITVDCQILEESVKQDDLATLVVAASKDEKVDGIMLQRPLPKGIDQNYIESLIDPGKDIDGIHPSNLGCLITEMPCYAPCTAMAVMQLMRHYQIDPGGKHVVIIGRSTVVGKPLAALLLQKKSGGNATVTVCHSRTTNLVSYTRQADILIAAIGKTEYVTSSMIKENSILIDVGINEKITADKAPAYVGDIDYNDCIDKALAITPVPGGIGAVTTAILFSNLVRACLEKRN